jgi:hypothetical protein
MQLSVAGTNTGFDCEPAKITQKAMRRAHCRPAEFIARRPTNEHPQTGNPPSHSATPELRQLLTSYQRVYPPSITYAAPVTYLAASLAR